MGTIAATLASIPKFPSSGNPIINPERALVRRNYVLQRMREEGMIDEATELVARAEPMHASPHEPKIEVEAPYVAEMVRAEMEQRYGAEATTSGLSVYTTLMADDQLAAVQTAFSSPYPLPVAAVYYDADFNCRGEFTLQSVKELADSIAEAGRLICPVAVQPWAKGGFDYRLIVGHRRFRADLPEVEGGQCPTCGTRNVFSEPRMFNLMFKTFMGPLEEEASQVYLRPETAQGIFVNFDNVLQAMRLKLPFGIAQIGKAFRNEITPGNFTFRTREFEQMEIEYFVMPGTDEEWHQKWIDERFAWYQKYGIQKEKIRLREHEKDELAHYAKRTADIEYQFPMGWSELEGIANRTDYDLKQHSKFSGKSLEYFDEESKQKVVPYVIEPSAGADRSTLAFLVDAYHQEEVRGEKRVVLRFHPELAPIKIAVLPLLKKNSRIVETAKRICADLRKRWHSVYDDTAAIGRLYRRQDEIGTPFCVTVDVQTVGDEKSGADDRVTIRDRDSMQQIRVPISALETTMADLMDGKWAEISGKFPKQA